MRLPKPHISSSSFGIYIHIPFCKTKCPYCDFNSYETSRPELKIREYSYVTALIEELNFLSKKYSLSEKLLSTIFFGGGTPSLLSGESVSRILSEIKNNFNICTNLEVTLEANPKSTVEEISEDKFEIFKEAGINRVSFGVQSLREDKLSFLGRWHNNNDSIRSLEFVRTKGVTDINLDSISGTTLDTPDTWREELNSFIKLDSTHLSSYLLTLEPGTIFGKKAKKGEVFTSNNDTQADIYLLTQEILAKENYFQYEVSNYSRLGFECAHNLLYWRGGEYLGLGAGAHSFLRFENEDGLRWSNTPDPKIYTKRIFDEKEASQRIDPVSRDQINLEKISFGLRLVEGISSDLIDPNKIPKYLFEKNYLVIKDNRIFIPTEFFRIADGIIGELV